MPASLLAVSDRATLPGGDLLPWFGALARAEVPAVLLREKDLPDLELLHLLQAARRILPPPCRLLISGRADLALAAGADGVHLPAAGLPVAALRRTFGRRLLFGCSTHSIAEVRERAAAGADYVTFGPVFSTPSKLRYGPPLGEAALADAAKVGIPVLALGGVSAERFPALAAAGARGAAGIRLFQDLDALRQVKAAASCFPRVASGDRDDA